MLCSVAWCPTWIAVRDSGTVGTVVGGEEGGAEEEGVVEEDRCTLFLYHTILATNTC